ncbi:unnamed protein product [Larinioides sclopetarius]|uniref:Uncharacterized protein n=1 Tax=Larinioides sclopetarius TaxID=280406 RepID=A0AAV2BR60_9ARAC
MFFEAALRKTLDVNVLYPRPNQGLQNGSNGACLDSSEDLSEAKPKNLQ